MSPSCVLGLDSNVPKSNTCQAAKNGMRKPVHILQLGASVEEIVNMAAVSVVDAQQKEKREETAQR